MDIKKMMDKKSKEPAMEADKKDAKLGALKGLRKMASDMMGDSLKSAGPMKKVTIAAPDSASLQEGLDKAKSIVPEMDKIMPESESGEGESEDMSSEEESEESALEEVKEAADKATSPEEIDAMIAELNAKKRELMHK